jgi:hypothetical protein
MFVMWAVIDADRILICFNIFGQSTIKPQIHFSNTDDGFVPLTKTFFKSFEYHAKPNTTEDYLILSKVDSFLLPSRAQTVKPEGKWSYETDEFLADLSQTIVCLDQDDCEQNPVLVLICYSKSWVR